MSGRPLRVAILAHSTLPRGGVAHALALGEALTRLGHGAVVHGPDPAGAGFFRPALCRTVGVDAAPLGPVGTFAMASARVADYLRHFRDPAARRFDVFLAGDGISGNALADLAERGLIPGFARVVHHLDDFADPRLSAMQARSVARADAVLCVSRAFAPRLAVEFGVEATIVGNGVDGARFRPEPDGREAALRARFKLGGDPVVLAIGGIEARKNTIRILDAFARLHAGRPDARLLIAGGASLLDHGPYRERFSARLAELVLPPGAVVMTGPLPDADMPALYRAADALAFPSLIEGFGIAVLEAMSCGLPVAVSRIAPFTDYLGVTDAAWCDPADSASIAAALTRALDPECRAALRRNGLAVATRHGWERVARRYLPVLERLTEPIHA